MHDALKGQRERFLPVYREWEKAWSVWSMRSLRSLRSVWSSGAAVYTALKQEEKGGCSDTWKSGW